MKKNKDDEVITENIEIGTLLPIVWFYDSDHKISGSSQIPPGWLLADGSRLLKLKYPLLYKFLMGTVKESSNYFHLPDTSPGIEYVLENYSKLSFIRKILTKLKLRKLKKNIVVNWLKTEDLPLYMIKTDD
jgi:hypothetical protein